MHLFFRGCHSKESKAFRSSYGNIAEVRSLLTKRVPLLALTATATKATFEHIITNLSMESPTVYSQTPDKRNICYTNISVPTKSTDEIFHPFIQIMLNEGYDCERVVVFCRKQSDVRAIYKSFHIVLGK